MPPPSTMPSGARQGARSAKPGRHGQRSGTRSPSHAGGGGQGSGPPRRRCAVYTRKSSEEGLEQEYNSLHAQREACEAYIRSQQHEGWRLVPDAYDDGGISGGTMERPALQALLEAIRAGRIDIIVVYKVDRLTRSLADFAKMVEVFDANGVSFVAVTQQFNTTSSMGRLTLNILLSFAQFEREVTGERIRDKIAASKRRGMWMGGRTPLGYEVRDRKLVVGAEDAATVVHFYRRYLAQGCVRRLKAELDGRGVVSKPRTYAGGMQAGGTPYSRGALYALLSNPVYIGQVRHKGECHPGQHEAIVPAELYAAVQAQLAASNGGGEKRARYKVEPSPLAGKLFDEAGERLVPTHARKGERRYRYYVSANLLVSKDKHAGDAPGKERSKLESAMQHWPKEAPLGWRLPAREVEQNVAAALQTMMIDHGALVSDALEAGLPASDVPNLLNWLARSRLHPGASPQAERSVRAEAEGMLQRVELSAEGMMLNLALPMSGPGEGNPGGASAVTLRRFVPHRVRRRGVEMRLVIEGSAAPPRNDAALLKAVARAHCWFEELVSGRATSAQAIAHRLGVTPRYVQRLLPLALLAPQLVERIVGGRHDAELTLDLLCERGILPQRWTDQVASLAN